MVRLRQRILIRHDVTMQALFGNFVADSVTATFRSSMLSVTMNHPACITCHARLWCLSLIISVFVLLTGCSSQPGVDISDRSINVDKDVRAAASEDGQGLQIKPLQSPGVQDLLADAEVAEQAGEYRVATVLVERAMRMQPEDPEILQRMAELKLAAEDFEQALNYAARSYDLGPRIGELCSRNWHTIAVARTQLDDQPGAATARQRAGECSPAPAERF